MESNPYSRRLRSGERSRRMRAASTSSESEEEFGSRRYGYTPEPVQRTLHLRPEDVDEDDDDYDDDFEELDDYEGTMYRSTTYQPPPQHEDERHEAEEVEDEEETPSPVRRSDLKRRAAGAAAFFHTEQGDDSVVKKIASSAVVKTVMKYLRRLWRFVLRNSFMAVNVLWLLAPLCCFVIAITVPQYLTTSIQYVDVLSSSVTGRVNSADLEKGAMRTAIQEMVDLKLSGVNEEIALLRRRVKSQEREVEALRLLHDSLQHSHDEAQQKFSLAEKDSELTAHVEKIVAKHTEALWEKFVENTSQLQQEIITATKQQSVLSSAMKTQEEKIDTVVKKTSTISSSEPAGESPRDMDTKKEEFVEWREAFERDLQSEVQRKVDAIENHMAKILQEEKRALSSSVDALRGLDATDPGILRVIEVAVQAVEIKKTGRVDHAALANGASVVHTERDLLYSDDFSSVGYLSHLVGLDGSDNDGRFTSPSYRHAPAPFLGLLLSSGEIPWWLSRHNGRPETALSETMEMGSCWGIAGSSGRLSVKFAQQIIADSVTIDHIPAQIASDFRSAPNEFRVLGISGHPLRETVKFIPFGNFSYESNGAASQTFKLTSPVSQRSVIDGMALEVLSNHGHPDFTCLYRFRVHGQPV